MRGLPAVLLFVLFAFPAAAGIRFVSTNQWIMPETQVETDELWLRTGGATLAGVFEQDFFLLTGPAVLGATFEGDVWCAADSIEFEGTCGASARFAARTVTVAGEIRNNLLCAASSINITPSGSVGQSARLVGEDVMFQGIIEGDLTVYASSAKIGGAINGNLIVAANDITILPGAMIAKNLEYIRQQELILDSRVKLGGELVRRDLTDLVAPTPRATWTQRLLHQGYFLLAALLAGAMWMLFSPVTTAQSIFQISASPLKCFFVGLLVLLAVPVIALMLMFSLFGLPLGAILLALYAIMVYLAKILPAYYIGFLLVRRKVRADSMGTYLGLLALGLLVIYAVALLPEAGFFIWLLTTAMGLGGVILAHIQMRRQARAALQQYLQGQGNPPPPPDQPPFDGAPGAA